MKLKVQGHDSLVRDLKSNAIVNNSNIEYQIYMNRIKSREQQGDQIRNTIKEINTLKQELFEIKELLKEVIKK
jgi:prefoldin subunit 5